MTVIYRPLLLICLIWLLSGCSTVSQMSEKQHRLAELNFRQAHDNRVLDLNKLTPIGPKSSSYLDYYNLIPGKQRSGIQYFAGIVKISENEISSHVFVPEKPIGTVFILHGYFDHVGALNNIINFALKEHYAVFTYDLPGHGMSSGSRGDIGGISHNSRLLETIVERYRDHLPKPYQLVGFSTGGTIALEHARTSVSSPFEKKVLVSPLLHHSYWRLGKTAYMLFGSLLERVPRRNRNNSTNTQYLLFAAQDPLRTSYVSAKFLQQLYRWNRDFYQTPGFRSNMLVLQGNLDSVVDWKYNLPLLEQKIEGLPIRMLRQGKHQLFNEVKPVREEVFREIFNFFNAQ